MKASSISHKKSLSTSIILMLLISLAMIPMIARGEITSTGTYFWVDPPTNIVEPVYATFPVNIMIENAPTTYAWEATLNFDNNTLGVMSIIEGPWLSTGAGSDGTFFVHTSLVKANETGTISFGCTLMGVAPGASGSGLLCTIVFHVEDCGRSPLDLQDTALLDMDLARTDYPNNDGFFCATCAVECLHDVAIVNVTAIPACTPVPAGLKIPITVTIKNEGNHTQHVNVTVSAIYEFCGVVEIPIGTNSCITIEPHQVIPVKFKWDTVGVPGEKYKIKTIVKTVEPDDDPHDNVFIGPEVRVTHVNDIKVTAVKLVTPRVYVGYTAAATVSVVNEGRNRADVNCDGFIGSDDIIIIQKKANYGQFTKKSFNVEVYAGDVKVATVGVVNLAEGESRDLTGAWVPMTAGVYAIKAEVPAVTGETDTDDNERVDGAVNVIYDDVAVIGATMNATEVPYCSTVGINTTILNNGTDFAGFMVYVWARNVTDTADERLVGLIVGGALAAGANHTFVGLAPYGGIATSKESLAPPYKSLEPGTYGIYVIVVKWYGLDLNPNNDVFYAGTLTVTQT